MRKTLKEALDMRQGNYIPEDRRGKHFNWEEREIIENLYNIQ